MRETGFIKQNKEKWAELEEMLDGQRTRPEKLRELFVQVTDDLSFSRTFYPNRSVRVYLNNLAQRLFLQVYQRGRSRQGRFLQFWVDELPLLVYESRGAFRLSFGVFALAVLIGILSCAMDDSFVQVVLGEDYVSMTQTNIEKGDPMAVYKERGEFGMFLGITLNNLYVAFLTFIMGVFMGVGSIIILISNGVMLGAFQWFFVEAGLFQESFLTIWIHGTLEISAIIIAGAAGITMGQGPAFPGTYTRLQAFQRSARRGVKIMIGTVPLFLLAGFFEGYLTRQTDTPDSIRLLFIMVCLVFVLFYFVYYPWYRGRRHQRENRGEYALPFQHTSATDLGRIWGAGEVFSAVFRLLRQRGGRVLGLAVLGAGLYTMLVFGWVKASPSEVVNLYQPQTKLETMLLLFGGGTYGWVLRVAHTLVLGVLATVAYQWVYRLERKEALTRRAWLKRWVRLFLPVLVLSLAVGLYHWVIVLNFFLLPFLLVWGYVVARGTDVLAGMGTARRLVAQQYGRSLGLLVLLALLGLLSFTILDSIAFQILSMAIGWVVHFEAETMQQIRHVFQVFCMVSITNLLWIVLFLGYGLLFYSLREISEATILREKIGQIGQRTFIRGLERE